MRYAALFDVDGTLVHMKTMFEVERHWCRSRNLATGEAEFAEMALEARRQAAAGVPREAINRWYYARFRGRSELAVRRAAETWFRKIEPLLPSLWRIPALEALRWHQDRGAEVVFVSGSFDAALRPLARLLGVRHVLGARLEVCDGLYTGQLSFPQTIGLGKAVIARAFLSEHALLPERSWAYGDHVSDLPMLEVVGHPVAVGDDPALRLAAEARGYQALSRARVMEERHA